ncbi:hypothetical protein [Rouxiella sp. Mn2063]|uniref:hypothetical protein n=1 Tax=Rouxiella sp. Mn2063 TaxID=3395262 RepID=UPI003BDA0259
MFNFINTFKRLIGAQQPDSSQNEDSKEQLIGWATGCMLEGLPEEFYKARLLCIRYPNPEKPDGHIVSVNHDVMLTPDSEYQRFQPADDLYPVQCVEAILKNEKWDTAIIIFDKDTASLEYS